MKITYIEGNLLDAPEKVIAHGCNAQGVMQSGIAKAIRAKYSNAYVDYRMTYRRQGNKLELGQIIETKYGFKTILNIITQEHYGRDPNTVYVSYPAITKAVKTINAMGYDRVAFPLIGAGLANGSWERISEIIEAHSHFDPIVYYLYGEQPKEANG